MRSIRLWLVASVTAVVTGGGMLVVTGAGTLTRGPAVSLAAAVLPPAAPGPAPSVSPAPAVSLAPVVGARAAGDTAQQLTATDRAKRITALNAALRKLAGGTPSFSAAVLDRRTGLAYAYRGSVAFDTASIVKVQILGCMLLRAQDAGRRPTSAEMALAGPMIRLSDNNAATALYRKVGGRTGVTGCNKRLGLTRTVVNTRWGLTRTTATDQIKLLAALINPKGPLNASSRKTAFTLMNTVDRAQDWGVPSIARTGETTTVKNGWDTRTADGGLWAVNTIGRVTAKNGAVDVSVVVLSHNNRSMRGGVTLVEKVAQLTRRHLGY